MDSQVQQNKKGISSMDMVMKSDEEMNKMGSSSIKRSRMSWEGSKMTVLRFVAMGLTLVAAVVAGTNKESQIIPFTLVTGLPPLHVPLTAKWHYLSSTVYFVVANAIACTYSASSLVLLMVSQRRSITEFTLMQLPLLLLISDLIMVALLFSANGAAVAVGVIGIHGNSHTQWNKVCNMFKKYCQYSEASVVISMIGSIVFLSLVVLATLKLHKKSSW